DDALAQVRAQQADELVDARLGRFNHHLLPLQEGIQVIDGLGGVCEWLDAALLAEVLGDPSGVRADLLKLRHPKPLHPGGRTSAYVPPPPTILRASSPACKRTPPRVAGSALRGSPPIGYMARNQSTAKRCTSFLCASVAGGRAGRAEVFP